MPGDHGKLGTLTRIVTEENPMTQAGKAHSFTQVMWRPELVVLATHLHISHETEFCAMAFPVISQQNSQHGRVTSDQTDTTHLA